MSKPYNPRDWYWIVGGDVSRVFSSATGNYVQPTNPAYTSWSADEGGSPSQIASEAELGEVLSAYSLRPAAAGVLEGYKDTQARELTLASAAKLFLNHENRVRALEGKAAVNAAQFRAFIKAEVM